jgi:hypothetical protein
MKEEIKSTGGISEELKDKMFATYPSFRRVWGGLEDIVSHDEALVRQEATSLLEVSNIPDSQRESANTTTLAAVTNLAINCVEHLGEENIDFIANVAYDRRSIPSGDAIDKIVRCGNLVDRELSRAQQRLPSAAEENRFLLPCVCV